MREYLGREERVGKGRGERRGWEGGEGEWEGGKGRRRWEGEEKEYGKEGWKREGENGKEKWEER